MSRGVLIVDDDPFIRKLIATTLEDVAGFELHEAQDGLEALEVAHRERPAIVFLDVDMPRLDGISACRELRQAAATRETTIVMLTAAHGDRVEKEAEDAGADLFLTKPFSPLDLLRLVDRSATTVDDGGRPRRAARVRARRRRLTDFDQDERVDHEGDRKADRPAVQVCARPANRRDRPLPVPTPNAPESPASLPECIRIRKTSPTAMTTWTKSRNVAIGWEC